MSRPASATTLPPTCACTLTTRSTPATHTFGNLLMGVVVRQGLQAPAGPQETRARPPRRSRQDKRQYALCHLFTGVGKGTPEYTIPYYSPEVDPTHLQRHQPVKRGRSEEVVDALDLNDPLWQFLLDVKKKKIAPDYTQDMADRLEELAPALNDQQPEHKTTEQDLLELNHFLTLLQEEIGLMDTKPIMDKPLNGSPTTSPYKSFTSAGVPLTSQVPNTELRQQYAPFNPETDFSLSTPLNQNDPEVAYAMQLFPGLSPADAVYAAYNVRVKQTWPPEKSDVPSIPPQALQQPKPKPSAPPLDKLYALPPAPMANIARSTAQKPFLFKRSSGKKPQAIVPGYPVLPPPVPTYVPVLVPQGEAAAYYQHQWALYHQQQQQQQGQQVLVPMYMTPQHPYNFVPQNPFNRKGGQRDIFRQRSKSVDATPSKKKASFGLSDFFGKLFSKRDASPPRERKPRRHDDDDFIELDAPSRELTESPIHEEPQPMDLMDYDMTLKSAAVDASVTPYHVTTRRIYSDTNLPRLCVALRKMNHQMMLQQEHVVLHKTQETQDGWVNIERLLEPMNKLSIHNRPTRAKTALVRVKNQVSPSRQMSIDEPETRMHHMTLITTMLSRINKMLKSNTKPTPMVEDEEWQLVKADL